MSSVVPSRAALRHLARLCRETRGISATPSTVCSARTQLPRHKSSRSLSITNHRKFTTTTPKDDQSSPSTSAAASTSTPSDPPPSSSQTRPDPTTPQLPDTTNYYTLFPTLPSPLAASSTFQFRINPASLRRSYLQLQAQFHPDKYSPGTAAHKNALALSALINTAFKTLSDPLLRGQYLLQLRYGVDVTSEDSSENRTDQGTLIEVMEAQEAVEDADSQDQVDALKDENQTRVRATEEEMGHAFENDDQEAARKACVRLKYWRSLQQGLDDWEPGKEVRLVH